MATPDQSKVTVSSRIQQNLGVRTARWWRACSRPQVSAVGSIAYNERDQVIVQARATGYVERLYVRATLDRVAKVGRWPNSMCPTGLRHMGGFLSVRRMRGTDLASLVDGARQLNAAGGYE